ncbi:lactate utilization protein C [Halobacillus shinanisalinarum]|uniref:Lactate utilization protein C n=1 Tax=Halobacillus shinanisalinarum TaxID=2932258 RepID=A0ABY4GY16_9BACI|nr:lactate utilization protein C [Halobacillus shinanisalinarum]UOQ92911.1 lactate utilization protein C [Halobacillus shinanisalinarum]
MTKGTIQNKDMFLNNIASRLGRERKKAGVTKPAWKHQPQWSVLQDKTEDELVDVLEQQCGDIHTDFVRTDRSGLGEEITKVMEKYHLRSAVTWDDPRFDTFALRNNLEELQTNRDIDVFTWDARNGEESIRRAEQADVGITFSDATLAESGTVVLFSDTGKGRSVSLLPSTYVAIIPKSTIVPRMSQVTREIHQRIEGGEQVASCVNFITGPSNSADIEMNNVYGVHGPIQATYIVVEDQ